MEPLRPDPEGRAALRVLHLDDNPRDAELVREKILAEDRGRWEFVHVQTREAYEHAIERGAFELVLTDYSIPGYDGMAAVRLAHRCHPDLPIIVISGTLCEEDAVAVLKAGATDYVFKERLQRLPAAARRAVEEARERRRRREAEVAMRAISARLNELAENSQDVFWMRTVEPPRLVYVSPSVRRVFGIAPEALFADPAAIFGMLHPDDRGRVQRAFDEWLAGRAARFEEEYRVVHADGSVRWIQDSGTRLPEDDGRLVHVSGVARDITERKRVEAEIRSLNVGLERKVEERTRELEAFSYSVSHDLRAPLHAIKGFAEALEEDYGARLDAAGQRYLSRIRAGAERMDALIDDLLSLSRISRADLVAGSVDLSALACEVLAEARDREPQRRHRFRVEPGLCAYGDEGLLRVALDNLIGNAWKFSSKRAETVIEVGQAPDEGAYATFFVRDEGAGFDPAYAAKLFGAFQRLHGQQEFPGTGIGLATVRRVIERHGGRVRAEGAVDRGATFYFSLPKRP